MNALVFVALLCAVAGATAQAVLPSWLPQMVPYACVWCSGRYYRRSPQYLTTGNGVGAVGSVGTQNRDLAAHAGYFYDIIPKTPVKNEKSSCIYLVNMYRGNQGPVAVGELMSYINMSFFGPQQTKDYSDKPHPLAFQCCHYKYGRQLMDKIDVKTTTNNNYQNYNSDVSTTEVPVETTTDVTDTSTVDTTGVTTEVTGIPIVNLHNKKRHGRKIELGARTVFPNIDISDVTETDIYKAPMPQILPEGYDCNMLIRQLYMELSQDNVVRQKQIQKAMARNSRRAIGRQDDEGDDSIKQQ